MVSVGLKELECKDEKVKFKKFEVMQLRMISISKLPAGE